MQLNNLFFLSGPHGSGKTTLLKRLLEEMPEAVFPELKTKTPKFYSLTEVVEIDFFHRQALKHAQRAIENYEYFVYALQHPEQVVFGNRCIYDDLAYTEAYAIRGWITKIEKERLDETYPILYSRNELREPFAIVLNPPLEVVERHLEKRWQTAEKKFMEEDEGYLRAVCESYKKYKFDKNVLYVENEMGMDEQEQLETIKEWVLERSSAELAVA